MRYSPLTVSQTRMEIGGQAKTVVFEGPFFSWFAGQHLPIWLMIDGHEVQRSYSISSAPGQSLRITVKRVTGGLASNYLNDYIQPGDVIEAAVPGGSFVLKPVP